MASLRKRGRSWYYRYVDADGVQHERKGCPDRRETEAMAAALEAEASKIRSGLIDPKAIVSRDHEARPLAEHLADFQRMLEAKNGTAKHASVSTNRARRVLNLAGVRRISGLTLSKAIDALAALRSQGMSQETINHHTRAVKAFSRWLWKDGRARDHALAHLATSSSESDRRRTRRALSTDEATRLVQAAERGPTVQGMTGHDRATLYRIALATGFRSAELASLTVASFRLDSSPPTIVCQAAYTKNGKLANNRSPRPWRTCYGTSWTRGRTISPSSP